MAKGIKILIVALIILVGVLAAGGGFFFAKSLSLEKKLSSDGNNVAEKTTDLKDKSTSTNTNSTDLVANPVANGSNVSNVTAPAALGNRPSAPTDTYTVAAGDTMFSIGQKVDVNWTILADANGLSEDDANKIKVGQVLLVPKNNQINYAVNQTKAQEIQTKVDSGKDIFRLSATDTTKSDAPSAYGLAVTDTFTQKTIDNTAGTATVTGVHNGKTYEIKLTQPAAKGAKGIWAIESIKLSK